MKTFAKCVGKFTNCIGVVMAAAKKLWLSIKRSKELENGYFKMQRIGNTVKVESKGIGNGFGVIYIDKSYIRKTFQVMRNDACDEFDFCGLSASTLRSVRIGQSMSAILRRRDCQLRFEMIQGGNGCLGLGRKENEDEQRTALLSLEVGALQLFDAEELRVSMSDVRARTTWAMEHPYGYVHK